MPSANYIADSFFAPAFLNQGQNPLSADNFAAPAIVAQVQSSTAAILLSEWPPMFGVQSPAEAVYLYEWPPMFGVQSPASAILLAGEDTTQIIVNNRYYQRVFSSGLGVWCYYSTLNGIDPSPVSSATSPNWTGSIAGYQLITTVAVP